MTRILRLASALAALLVGAASGAYAEDTLKLASQRHLLDDEREHLDQCQCA